MLGGHALKKAITERKTTKEFLEIADSIIPKLNEIFSTDFHILKYYSKKPDHGDMDILMMVRENFNINVREALNALYPIEIASNDSTYSFDFSEFQIDLTLVPEKHWESTKFWMDYDPSSNLLGKLFHKFALKYRPEGLYFPYRSEGGRAMKDILITTDFRKMMTFMGLDPEQKYNGFDTLEQIFDWIISSKYFNPELFQFENLNQTDRKRNRKRPTFNKFLEYIKDVKFESEGYSFEKNKEIYREFIDKSFPEAKLLATIAELEEQDKNNQTIIAKFNGSLVMEWTGLKDKELGKCLMRYRADRMEIFLKEKTADEIKSDFLGWYYESMMNDIQNKII